MTRTQKRGYAKTATAKRVEPQIEIMILSCKVNAMLD